MTISCARPSIPRAPDTRTIVAPHATVLSLVRFPSIAVRTTVRALTRGRRGSGTCAGATVRVASLPSRWPAVAAGVGAWGLILAPLRGVAQATPLRSAVAQDSVPTRVTVHVVRRSATDAVDSLPVADARVRSAEVSGVTDATGDVTLALPAGRRTLTITRIGYAPDSVVLVLRAGADTTLTAALRANAPTLAGVIVSATRSGRTADAEPTKVEVIEPEDVGEKVAMTPGSSAMILSEAPGVRVVTTSPASAPPVSASGGSAAATRPSSPTASPCSAPRPRGSACSKCHPSTSTTSRSSRAPRRRSTAARRSAA